MFEILDLSVFRYDGEKEFKIGEVPTMVTPRYFGNKDYRRKMSEGCACLQELQEMMYADARYGMLVIFQAIDAAGKDGTIRRVFAGVSPQGLSVHAFKRPNEEELHHDFLWRTMDHLPARGSISVFNRSYYEETLVARVHPEIVKKHQRLPEECLEDFDSIWSQRWKSMNEHEAHLVRNGIRVVKFFLNVSKDEQKRRFLDRIEEEDKNWKFNDGDLKERAYWDQYQEAFEDTINATGTKEAPWYVIPADDKKTAHLLVSGTLRYELGRLGLSFPEVSRERKEVLGKYRDQLLAEEG